MSPAVSFDMGGSLPTGATYIDHVGVRERTTTRPLFRRLRTLLSLIAFKGTPNALEASVIAAMIITAVTLRTLQHERELAERIEQGIKQLRSRTSVPEEGKRTA
jgi:hypothetical protein